MQSHQQNFVPPPATFSPYKRAKGRNRTFAFSEVPEFTPSEEYVERNPLRANMVQRSHD